MQSTAEVVIIGGGIQGISLAYHLARLGLTDACLLEMNTLGSGSSGRSAAIIGHAFQSERCLALTRLSFDALMRFEQELGTTPDYRPIGCLLLAGPVSAGDLCRRHALLQSIGMESNLVDRDTIDRLTPGLNLQGVDLGLHVLRDGEIDPHSIMMGYASHARRMGVRIIEGVEATGLEIRGERVTGVHTTAGLIGAGCVVNAAGFRARQVGRWAGMDLPIANLKRHILVTGPVAGYAQPIPFTYEVEAAWYMRREGPGLLLGMGAVETDEEEPQVDQTALDQIIEHAMRRAPALATAGLMTSWAGLRPVTPDDDPILGRAPRLPNFVNDCGWGGHGIMNAPAAGMALAELIIQGVAHSVDISHMCFERFQVN